MSTIMTVWNWYRSYFAAGGYGVLFVIALCWLWKRHLNSPEAGCKKTGYKEKEEGCAAAGAGQKTGKTAVNAAGGSERMPQSKAGRNFTPAAVSDTLPRAERERRFLWPVMILLALIFCPVSAWAIMKAIGRDVYWRVFWILPVIPVLAGTLTELVRALPGRWHRLLAVLGVASVLALNGTWVLGDTFFSQREDRYKLPARIIEVGDAIEEHATQHKEMRRVVAQADIAVLIRLYKPSFISYYGRQAMQKPKMQTALYREINASTPDPQALVSLSEKYYYCYLVLKQDQDDRQGMLAQGLEVIMDQDGYVVYYDPYFAHQREQKAQAEKQGLRPVSRL